MNQVLQALICLVFICACLPFYAQNPNTMNAMDHGPFVTSTMTYDARSNSSIFVNKGIAVKVGEDPKAIIVFDTDLLRMASAWTGGLLYWNPDERDGLEEWPTPQGYTHFETGKSVGWTLDGKFDDPRKWKYGPLPKEESQYQGLYVNNGNVLFSYTIGNAQILETPGYEKVQSRPIFTRTIKVNSSDEKLSMRLLQAPEGATIQVEELAGKSEYVKISVGGYTRVVGLHGDLNSTTWRIKNRHLILDLPKIEEPVQFSLAIGPVESSEKTDYMISYLEDVGEISDIERLKKPGRDQYEVVATKAVMGTEEGPYQIDQLTLPENNPWNSFMRMTAIDFFEDGRAVVTSISGDVWIVEGIQENLRTLRWHRYATGLFQPLGVKVVDDEVYITGRDQITRLHDYNKDGYADYYESFNNEIMAANNFHAFTLNLETDTEGNFYFAKSTPWPPYVRGKGLPRNEEINPHQGALFKLSPDGEKLDIIARGLRNPNGLSIDSNGEMVYADNEGNWVPTSKVHRIKKGGFHGFIPSSGLADQPTDFELPIAWIPHHMDNSPAKPIFITSDRWPKELHGDMLLASYARSSLSLILKEEVNGVWQGAHIPLPYMFKSGLENGRFHTDGHLYVTGMRSWQCIGEDWGTFERFRYTKKNLNAPIAIETKAGGLEIRFNEKLDKETATNIDNYKLQKWTYPWTKQYGTHGKLYSIDKPGESKPDPVQVELVEISKDRKSVFLKISSLKPGKVNTKIGTIEDLPEMIETSLGMVVSISYKLETKGGEKLSHLIHKTIHRVPNETFKK